MSLLHCVNMISPHFNVFVHHLIRICFICARIHNASFNSKVFAYVVEGMNIFTRGGKCKALDMKMFMFYHHFTIT